MRYSVSIIGAGTAGLISARRLGELGIGAVVYDQKQVPGIPVRASGILSIGGLAKLGVNYSSCMTNRLHGARIYAEEQMFRVASPDPIALVLDRKKLNEVCIDDATAAGACVVTGKKVQGNALDEIARRGTLIGADGAVSSVARHFGFGEIDKFAITYKAEYEALATEQGIVELFFDNKKYPGLFGWTCPNRKDLLEVGVGVYSGAGNAKRAFDMLIEDKHISWLIDGRRQVSHNASIIPMDIRGRIVDEDKRVLLVGDAAGQVKATTGGGIIFGGNAAMMAAEAIAMNFEKDTPLGNYQKRFMKTYGLDLKMHKFINNIYGRIGNAQLQNIVSILNKVGADQFLSKYGDMDSPSLVLKRFFLRDFA